MPGKEYQQKEPEEVKQLNSVHEYTKKKYIEELNTYEKLIKKLEKNVANHNDSLKDKENALAVAQKELDELKKLSLQIL